MENRNYLIKDILDKSVKVVISELELNFINSFTENKPNFLFKKSLFVALVLAKALDNGNKIEMEHLNYIAHVLCTKDIEDRLFKTATQFELLSADTLNELRKRIDFKKEIFYRLKSTFLHYSEYFSYDAKSGSFEILCVENTKEGTTVSLGNDIMETYELLFGKKQMDNHCVVCGNEFSRNNNKQKYCKVCSANKLREQKRLHMRKVRMNVEQ